MSSQRINLTTSTPTQAGRISTIRLVSQSVTGPAGADGAGVSVATKEGGTTKVATTTVLDFDGTNFDVTGSSGTATIVIASGQYDASGAASTAVSNHVAAGDPHTQYALGSALGTAAYISSSAGGDLSGTLPSPTVAKINGIAVTGTPAVGYVPTATSTSAATWQAPSGGGGSDPLDGNAVIASRILAR